METKKTRKRKTMKKVTLVKDEPKVEEKPVVISKPKIDFAIWFARKLSSKKVKFWQEYPIEIFMEKQGLFTAATEDQYDEAFERF